MSDCSVTMLQQCSFLIPMSLACIVNRPYHANSSSGFIALR